MNWEREDISTPRQLEFDLLERNSTKYDIPVRLPQKLLDAEWQYYGMRRRGLIHKTIEKIMNEDWRSFEEIQAEMATRQQQADRSRETG